MAGVVIAALGACVATLVLHLAWTGALVDLGAGSSAWIAAALLGGAGWGLRARRRGPSWLEGLALALGLPLRGPLTDLVAWLLPPGDATLAAAAVLTLLPLGVVVGRQVARASAGRAASLATGLSAGVALVAAGVLAWTPVLLAGPASAAILAGLQRAAARAPEAGDPPPSLHAGAALGYALATAVLVLRRVAAAYHAPGLAPTSETVLVLLVPALLVAAPVTILAAGDGMRRLFTVAAAAALAWALQSLADPLGMYTVPGLHVNASRRLHELALHFPFAEEWWLWLLSFGGWISVATGVALGALRARAVGPLLSGAAAAVAVHQLVVAADPVRLTGWPHEIVFVGPLTLLLLAAGAAWVAIATALFGRAGWLAVPLLAAPLLLVPPEKHVSFEDVRRIGEPAVDATQRRPTADVVAFSTFGAHQLSPEGVIRYHDTFTGERHPWDPEDLLAGLDRSADEPHRHEPPELDAEPDMATPARARRFGLRVGGVALHADHAPVGAEGSASRLVRLLAPPGPTLLVGIGAELLAGDLSAAGRAAPLEVASAVPLGIFPFMVIEDAVGQQGFLGRIGDDPVARLSEVSARWSAVVVAPGRPEWPETDALLARESLQRMADRLAPGGRALVWIDSTRLDARALRARLAAFGSVFGEQAFALVEPRGLDPPFVLMVGWRDEAGRPRAEDLAARLPWPDVTGTRTRLHGLDDLAAMLVLDGPGLASLAEGSAVHRRSRPVPTCWFAAGGWLAVAAVIDPGARLDRAVSGAPPAPSRWPPGLLAGLALHGTYDYQLHRLRTQVVETVQDVDWETFDREWVLYAEAARSDPDHPLLVGAVAALLEPLAIEQDYTRFATVYEAVGASGMPSWRLAAAEAAVRLATLQPEAARAAAERAIALRGPVGD